MSRKIYAMIPVLVAILVLVTVIAVAVMMPRRDHYRSCRTCEQGGWLGPAINPFIYPNSGESCPEIYMAVHRNTPDHVPPE